MRVHRRVVTQGRAELEQRFVARSWMDESFRRRHSGLYPAGPEARRQHAAELIAEALVKLDASPFSPDRMVALYDQVRPLVQGSELEIGVATIGEFMISDTPAQSLGAGVPGVGPLGGVPWDRATTIVMPIGRRHVVGLGKQAGFVDLERTDVDYLNRVQVMAAEHELAWHPAADLMPFALGALDAAPEAV